MADVQLPLPLLAVFHDDRGRVLWRVNIRHVAFRPGILDLVRVGDEAATKAANKIFGEHGFVRCCLAAERDVDRTQARVPVGQSAAFVWSTTSLLCTRQPVGRSHGRLSPRAKRDKDRHVALPQPMHAVPRRSVPTKRFVSEKAGRDHS